MSAEARQAGNAFINTQPAYAKASAGEGGEGGIRSYENRVKLWVTAEAEMPVNTEFTSNGFQLVTK